MAKQEPKEIPSYLRLVANEAWGDEYWEEQRVPETPEGFAYDLYHLHPQDTDGYTHREENAVYHIFENGEYRTLPENAPKLEF